MYSVSEAYIEQMMKSGTRRRLSGTIGNISFTGSDVVKDSFGISGRAAEESETKIGGVYLGQLDMTLVPSFLNKIPRDQYEGKEATIYIGLLIDYENDVWVDVPIGVYTLQAPKISKQGISVSGYDHMKKLDIPTTIDTTSGTPYQYLTYLATACNVELGNLQEEIEALPNGLEVLPLYAENDIETFRDLLYWLAQACVCFACADREGKIVLRKFGVPNDVEFDESKRDADVVFSGYMTKWTGISFVNIEDDTTSYYGLEVDDGLTMNLGANPFLQLGSSEAIERRRKAVLNAVSLIQYTPYYVNSARDPIFDLGDEINFTGGISGNCTGCVMANTFSLDNFTFEGYGDNPALATAKNKTDKNISNLRKKTSENELNYYNFANLDRIAFVAEQEKQIAKIAFTPTEDTTVKILHEFIMNFKLDLSKNNYYEVRYYLDGVLLPYKPRESLSAISITTDIPDEQEEETEPIESEISEVDLTITRDFFYVLKNVEKNIRHIWEVRILAHGCEEIVIDPDNAHITVEGQKLYGSEAFDGFLEFDDEFRLVPYGRMSLVSVSEHCVIDVVDNIIQSLGDTIGLYDCRSMEVLPAEDAVTILMEFIGMEMEDGDDIETEDGYRIDVQD